MTTPAHNCVLAVGIDAAEATLMRALMARGELPALQRLAETGAWLKVDSPAHVGSGAVWPTFITGEDPATHGVYGEWVWRPETMGVTRYQHAAQPFWQQWHRAGRRVGVLDVPFMPRVGLEQGFEVSEWGPHDVLDGRVTAAPAAAAEIIARMSLHPLASDRLDAGGPADYAALERHGRGLLEGIEKRGALALELIHGTKPDIALITFTEIHHAGHHLWHAWEPDSPVYRTPAFAGVHPTSPTLADLHRELDRQIGRLVADTTPRAVVVFALHGMRAAHGIPSFLPALLTEWGYSPPLGWRRRSWRQHAAAALGTIKRHAPAGLKRRYYRAVKTTTAQRMAGPNMLPLYDWDQTRVFAMPTDQHGWLRINLHGRESRGVVPFERYEPLLDELTTRLSALRAAQGAPLVERIVRTARTAHDASDLRLPDLVIHWSDAVFADSAIAGTSAHMTTVGTKFSGQHAMDGFCLVSGADAVSRARAGWAEGSIAVRDLHRLFDAIAGEPRL